MSSINRDDTSHYKRSLLHYRVVHKVKMKRMFILSCKNWCENKKWFLSTFCVLKKSLAVDKWDRFLFVRAWPNKYWVAYTSHIG